MSPSKLALSFRMFQNGQLIREDTLTQSVIKIGKVPSAHLQIVDQNVSRMHAIVEVTGREVSLIDLGSTRGTFVNGRKINKARLETGDVITLGDTRIEIGIGDAAASSPHADRAVEPQPQPQPPAIPAAPRAALPLDTVAGPPVVSHALAASADEVGTARAVEVTAMLGDSVVNVKHCIDPRTGKVTPATWGLVAGGAACLLASAIAFTASVHNAGENRARLETWTRVEHKPGYAFRPHPLGPDVDWIAFGGLGLALVGLTLGIVRMRNERTSPYYRIGNAAGVDLALDSAPAAAFPLVAPSGDDFVFNYGAGIDGELLLDGHATPLGELAAAGRSRPSASVAGAVEVPIPPKARIRARSGQTTFLISAVPRPRRQAVPLLAGLENRALSYFAGSLVVHLGIWAILQTIPPAATGVSLDLPVGEAILARLQGTANNDPVPEPGKDRGDAGGEPGGAPMPLPSGAAGKPDATDHGHLQIARTDAPPATARDAEIEYARTSGVLGVLQSATGVRVLGASEAIASGIDLESFNGPLYGGDGEGPGVFGGGLSGNLIGGGCFGEPCGTIPSGNPFGRGNLIGRIPGRGGDYRLPGRGFGDPSHHQPNPPRVGDPKVPGGYDKAIIRRYIRRNIDKIAYCYDKQLLAHPDLHGAITVTFFILPTGAVQSSSATGFDPEVASCVAGIVKAIEFPRPGEAAAGGVQVTYPFHFHAAGQPAS